jgi:ferric-dicitrate binding protein FerR (iron transport regulator)
MSESNTPHDADDERVLRENLRVPALSAEALARIRVATEAEWRRNVEPPVAQRRLLAGGAAAAALLAIAGAWIFWNRAVAPGGEPLAVLVRTGGEGVVERHAWWRDSVVNPGASLSPGARFEARGGSLLSFPDGGNLRIAPGTEFEVLSPESVRLERGQLYVDIPPGARPQASFVAITRAGEFRHVGTQFSVSVSDGATRLQVREGRVSWKSRDAETTVDAGSDLLIDRNDAVTRTALDASGARWQWAEALAPAFDIEDRPLIEFLEWVARETGRDLVVADARTRAQVGSILMHGDVGGMPPLQALEAVVASTSLRCEVTDGVIRVSLPGVSPVPAN